MTDCSRDVFLRKKGSDFGLELPSRKSVCVDVRHLDLRVDVCRVDVRHDD